MVGRRRGHGASSHTLEPVAKQHVPFRFGAAGGDAGREHGGAATFCAAQPLRDCGEREPWALAINEVLQRHVAGMTAFRALRDDVFARTQVADNARRWAAIWRAVWGGHGFTIGQVRPGDNEP